MIMIYTLEDLYKKVGGALEAYYNDYTEKYVLRIHLFHSTKILTCNSVFMKSQWQQDGFFVFHIPIYSQKYKYKRKVTHHVNYGFKSFTITVARALYLLHYKTIPEGYIIKHIDGDSLNDDPLNLIAVNKKGKINVSYKKR